MAYKNLGKFTDCFKASTTERRRGYCDSEAVAVAPDLSAARIECTKDS